MAWTKILPSAESAKRIPRGFSRVTIYSFKFILNGDEEEEDIATTLRTSLLRLLNPAFSLEPKYAIPLPSNTRPLPLRNEDPIKIDGEDRSRAPKPEICWRNAINRSNRDFLRMCVYGRSWNCEQKTRRQRKVRKKLVVHVSSRGTRFLVEVSSFLFSHTWHVSFPFSAKTKKKWK